MVVSSMQHHTHHQQQGPVPPHLQHSRPSSIVHQQHHSQTPAQQQQQPPPQSQHQGGYAYQGQNQTGSSQDHSLPYYAHPSPYSTPGATSGYTSAGKFFFFCPSWPSAKSSGSVLLTRRARYWRHDGCHNAETLPAHHLPHPPVELAGFGSVALGSRPAAKHVRTTSFAITPAVDVLWRPSTAILVDAGAGRTISLRAACATITPAHGLAARHDDVAHAAAAPYRSACPTALAAGDDGQPASR